MRIAVASGKGGTGKTTIAVSLATSWATEAEAGGVALLDCDVEAPNAHVFLRPELRETEVVTVPVPEIDAARCDGCGLCARLCRFGALLRLGPGAADAPILVLPELCHGCGGCLRVCGRGAIREVPRSIGRIERGWAGGIAFVRGVLNVGEASGTPLIRRVGRQAGTARVVVLDAPPGAACGLTATVRGADACLLVTEPTPFGLHDLRLAVQAVEALGVPAAVVVNRAGPGEAPVDEYCASLRLPVLARIPYSREIARLGAAGGILVRDLPELAPLFRDMCRRLEALARSGRRRQGRHAPPRDAVAAQRSA
jgi:MinD superfamily P-loop ATPase